MRFSIILEIISLAIISNQPELNLYFHLENSSISELIIIHIFYVLKVSTIYNSICMPSVFANTAIWFVFQMTIRGPFKSTPITICDSFIFSFSAFLWRIAVHECVYIENAHRKLVECESVGLWNAAFEMCTTIGFPGHNMFNLWGNCSNNHFALNPLDQISGIISNQF